MRARPQDGGISRRRIARSSHGVWVIILDSTPVAWWHSPRQMIRRYRRGLAAAAAAAAVFLLASALLRVVAPATDTVVVAVAHVPAGAVVQAADVTTSQWPTGLVPDDAIRDLDLAVGAMTPLPLARGEPITRTRLRVSSDSPGDVAGRVLVVVGLADPWSTALVGAGSVVDIHPVASAWAGDPVSYPASAGTAPLARDAIVVRVLGEPGFGPTDAELPSASGALPGDLLPEGGSRPNSSGALVVAVQPGEVAAIAAAAGSGVSISAAVPAGSPDQ